MGCKKSKKESQSNMITDNTQMDSDSIIKTTFGAMPDGTQVEKYTLKNPKGMEVDVITYGGIITRWTAPDKTGKYEDVVLGFDDLKSYLDGNPFFGALVGRYCNRIAKGKFNLDGKTYTLATNNGENHLHGGLKGFDKAVWKAEAKSTKKGSVLELTYTSADGEEGYPGKLDVKVTYTLTDDNELEVLYEAKTDKATVVNLTQHSYFNLSGNFTQSVLDHELFLNAGAFLTVDAGLIPTGELKPVVGTPFDFTTAHLIGQEIDSRNEQLQLGNGYDHCWVLNKKEREFELGARAYHPTTGRVLEVYTDEPGVQFYSGNFLDGTLPAQKGSIYGKRAGFCLETQHYPDSPNQPSFPSVRLNPGEAYTSKTTFKFLTK
ncbi:aldose epimerase family protein [Flagellimonas aequoris]|uniref:aldose epimerase family protein n=1 Tax=Flagellimonas aequoris TaxID=2306997 RepID=UPI003AAF862E